MPNKVEFLGLPCSGKTFILNKKYNPADVGFADQLPSYKRLFACLYQIFLNPKLFKLVLKTFFYVSLKDFKLHSIGVFRFYSRVYDVKSNQIDTLVLEEGVLQSLWGLLMFMHVTCESKCLSKNIYDMLSDVQRNVIYISCPKQIIISRNMLRTKKTRFSMELLKSDAKRIQQLRFWMAFVLKESKKDVTIDLEISLEKLADE